MPRQLNLKFAGYCRDNGKRWIAYLRTSEYCRMAYLHGVCNFKVWQYRTCVPMQYCKVHIQSDGSVIELPNTEGVMCYRGKNERGVCS
jgi:hypothetical protein